MSDLPQHNGRDVYAGAESIGPDPMPPTYAGWWIGKLYRSDGRELWSCLHTHNLPETATACAERHRDEQRAGDRYRLDH